MDYLGSHDDLWCYIGPIIAVDLEVGESGVLFLTELSVGHACPTKKERDVCRVVLKGDICYTSIQAF